MRRCEAVLSCKNLHNENHNFSTFLSELTMYIISYYIQFHLINRSLKSKENRVRGWKQLLELKDEGTWLRGRFIQERKVEGVRLGYLRIHKGMEKPCQLKCPWQYRKFISHQTMHSLDSSFPIFCFLLAWIKVLCKNFQRSDGEERGEGEEGREGGNEREFLPANSAVAELPTSEGEWSGRDREPGDRKVPVPLQDGGRGGLFSENWERFWWWCQKWSICLLRTLSANWHREHGPECQISL